MIIMQNFLESISFGPVWVEYLIFFLVSLVNVFLQNLKNIFLIKSTRLRAALLGTVTSIFYATVVVLIAKHGWISVLIIAVTHFFGIFIARTVGDYLEKKGRLNQK
jgi:CHASE2 domain-containing sensor protein